ncbi:hypothetical protein [uncultured Kriegella sp.]|uniref:hypothetical protein n=1 Tax=uncultured Kriegella sp. TaxID=1798910 RepID=UPI0030DC0A3A|tara:strand:+ start:109039 stop:110142 length:1104 start_codon:yes stop_codon:yes gene_type:complete
MERIALVLVLLFFGIGPSTQLFSQEVEKTIEIRGVYGNPKPLWEKGHNLKSLGVNSIFVHSGALTREMINRAKAEGALVFAEFATLNGKNYVDEHPEAWAINEKGEKVKAATWFMGVCPTDVGFRNYRMNQLRQLLIAFDLDGVWMDYVHWHAQFEDPEPILPETCFSDSCLITFSEDFGIQLPEGTAAKKAQWILENKEKEWREWRCQVIASWAKEIKGILAEMRPNALLGLYHCPWTDAEFNQARRRILGLDYDLLKQTVDVFSPMVYHGRMERKPTWVAENVAWLCDRLTIENDTSPKVWPIVQAHNDPHIISAKEFSTVLKGGLTYPSSGVMMFTTNAVAEDSQKIKVMRNLYRSIDSVQSSN